MSDVTHASRRWTVFEDYCGQGGRGGALPAEGASMARYYFHYRDKAGVVLDYEGMDLEGLADAQREALRGARWMLATSDFSADKVSDGAVEVCDDGGRVVFTLPLHEVEAPTSFNGARA